MSKIGYLTTSITVLWVKVQYFQNAEFFKLNLKTCSMPTNINNFNCLFRQTEKIKEAITISLVQDFETAFP